MNPIGMEQCAKFFERAALPVPFIPPEEQPKIMAIESPDTVFGTRKEPASLYDINAFVTEVLSKPTADYVLVGTGGHGVGSQALHYYAVKGQLAIFIQLDSRLDPEKIKATFVAIKRFYDAISNIAIPQNRRFLFVESQYYGSGYGWVEGQPGKVDQRTWHPKQPERSIYLDAFLELARTKKLLK